MWMTFYFPQYDIKMTAVTDDGSEHDENETWEDNSNNASRHERLQGELDNKHVTKFDTTLLVHPVDSISK